ncbi:MAG TPA: hypothetical protein VL225_04375 [Vicinamibacterales bacterium]|jgi:hypothetical protein|nr:hypothetical protein [Vicinamibacterales bacterium]
MRQIAARCRAIAPLIAALWLLAAAPAPQLRPLDGIADLKSWFNANRTHPRVIFLLSPT